MLNTLIVAIKANPAASVGTVLAIIAALALLWSTVQSTRTMTTGFDSAAEERKAIQTDVKTIQTDVKTIQTDVQTVKGAVDTTNQRLDTTNQRLEDGFKNLEELIRNGRNADDQ